jgi:hypothetical protein
MGEGAARFDPGLPLFFSADLLDFFLPNPRHPFWGSTFARITGGFHNGDSGFGLSLGWIAIGLLAATARSRFRSGGGRVWFWGFLCFWILSLGPALHVAGHVLRWLPLPQALLARVLPFLAGSRTPVRYLAPGGICLALALAGGWAALRRRQGFADNRTPARLEIGIGALLLFESLAAPLPVASVPVPEVYRAIVSASRAPGAFSLIHLPGIPSREDLLYQTVHRQRLVESVENAIPLRSHRGADPFSRPEWGALTRGFGSPGWVASMNEPQRNQAVQGLRAFLRGLNVRWVVVRSSKESLAPDGRSFLESPLLDPAVYDAFRQNLRLLGPLRETELSGGTLFEFEAEAAAR